MPRHLAVDRNVMSGTVSLAGVRTADVFYKDADGNQVYFDKAPRLQITVLSSTTQVPFRTKHLKVGDFYSGFIVGFQNAITIDVEWQATERA